MKTLRDYKDIHKNNDIYILASGKSVDFIDNSFFDNKIVIGINQVYKKVKCNYLIRKETQFIKKIATNNPSIILFVSRGDTGCDNNVNTNLINKFTNEEKKNIVIYDHNENKCGSDFNTLPDEGKLIVNYSTITSGIHLAAHMGAKNIILIGHDCGTIDNECNFKGYHSDSTYKIAHQSGEKGYREWLSKIENNTIKLKKLLKEKYECNVYSLNPFINFGLEGHIYKR